MTDFNSTFENWERTWRPHLNPFNNAAEFGGILFNHFGSFGKELALVEQQNIRRVWSLVRIGNHGFVVQPGIKPNAYGYFLTKKKRPKTQPETSFNTALEADHNCNQASLGLGCC